MISQLMVGINMKILLGLAIAMLLVGGGYGYELVRQNQSQEQQVGDYRAQLRQLLTETETSSLARLDYEEQIDKLQREVNVLNSQLRSASAQLALAQQGSTDIPALEREIRQQVAAEYRQQRDNEPAGSRTSLAKQLAQMEAMERSEFMSMQNRYGDFIGSLDVSDERMDVIIGALSNVIATENQARMELIQQVQSGEVSLETLPDKMMGVHDQESQLDELSYVLTEDELAAFSEYQDQQGGARIQLLSGPGGSVQESQTFFVGTGADGSPVSGEIRILRVETDN